MDLFKELRSIRLSVILSMIEVLIYECACDYGVEPNKILNELKTHKRPFVGSMKVINNTVSTFSMLEQIDREEMYSIIEEFTNMRGWEAYKDENRYKSDVR